MTRQPPGTQTLTIPVPANEWMSSNDRLHWAVKSKKTKLLRRRGWLEARRNGLFPMRRAFVIVSVQYAAAWSSRPSQRLPDSKSAGGRANRLRRTHRRRLQTPPGNDVQTRARQVP